VLLHYIFGALILISSLMVVVNKKPLYCLLWLIASFFNLSGIFVLLGADFLAMMNLIVYVGAVLVLFLFMVMMIPEQERKSEKSASRSVMAPITGAFLIFSILNVLYLFASPRAVSSKTIGASENEVTTSTICYYKLFFSSVSKFRVSDIAAVLYTEYIIPFQISGALLLAAMLGCVTLTLRKRKNAKRQDIISQIMRKNTVKLLKPKYKKGIYDN
jgi:NADH-quinone oxidoreductase subunit J